VVIKFAAWRPRPSGGEETPGTDPAAIDPTTMTVSRDPCGRWYVSFAVDMADPGP
jgi:hypothetical protein